MHNLIPKIARRLGIKLDRNRKPSDPKRAQWDGQSLGCIGLSDTNILHDIAHWLIATPERRCVPDFGLGSGPHDTDYDLQQCLPELVTPSQGSDEEALASALGIALEKAIGMKWEETAAWHSWYKYDIGTGKCTSLTDLYKAWEDLQARGYLDKDNVPFIVKEIQDVQKRSCVSCPRTKSSGVA